MNEKLVHIGLKLKIEIKITRSKIRNKINEKNGGHRNGC